MTVAPSQTEFYNVINIETRRAMGVSTGPELASYTPPPDAKLRLLKWVQSYLSRFGYLMPAEEAAALAAADVRRVRAIRDLVPATSGEEFWSGPSWRDATIEYHKDRGGRVSLLDQEPRR
jgi:hypothetical protein